MSCLRSVPVCVVAIVVVYVKERDTHTHDVLKATPDRQTDRQKNAPPNEVSE